MLQEKLFFIPTMGSLHRGHLSLIENAKQFELKIVVSIFVNPKQFNDSNDFKKYPRDIEKDFDILNNSKIDYLFTPDKEYVYGQNFKNIIHSGSIGKKDAQQLFLIKQYVGKNNLDIELLEGDIIRDSKGLALSSRNQLLSDQGLVAATGLKRHLDTLKEEYLQTQDVNQSINYALEQNKDRNLTVDYLHILDKNTFSKLTEETTNAIIIIAGYVEGIRLIDNIDFRVEI